MNLQSQRTRRWNQLSVGRGGHQNSVETVTPSIVAASDRSKAAPAPADSGARSDARTSVFQASCCGHHGCPTTRVGLTLDSFELIPS